MTDTAYADLPRSRREWAEDLVRRLRSESHHPPLRGRWLAYDSDDAFVAEHPKSSLVHYLDLYQTLYDAETLKTAIVEAKLFGPGIKAASRAKVLGGVACEGRQVSINATTKVNFLCIGAVPPWTPQEQLREWPYDLRPCCMRHDPHRLSCARSSAAHPHPHPAVASRQPSRVRLKPLLTSASKRRAYSCSRCSTLGSQLSGAG